MPSRQPIWRVTDRGTFAAFRRGRRVRVGPLTVTHLPPPVGDEAVRIAYVVGRSVGGAVTRNRVRRRLRAAVRQVHSEVAIPPGSYLIGATVEAEGNPWSELVSDLGDAVAGASGTTR